MYTVRINNRLPQAYRICNAAPAVAYNTTRDMALFPRLVANDFAPMFRLMDDYASHVATRSGFNATLENSFRSFNPRFDVREMSEGYELKGELPGIHQNDINIEFTGPQTLSIKGRTETRRGEGSRPGATTAAATAEGQSEPATLPESETKTVSETSETAPSESSSYHKPTVEDEDNADAASVHSVAAETPAESTVAEKENTVAAAPQQSEAQESSRYWISERSIGTFQRSFAFPTRIDQENVKASLKDGILSVVIPKATLPASRRIKIE